MQDGVIAIIYDENKEKVIWIKRNDIPIWVLPGGGIDPGETPEKALLREAKEETGFNITIQRKVGEYTPQNKLSTLTHVYECKIKDGNFQLGAETAAIDFFPLKAFPKPFFPLHEEWLQDCHSGHDVVIRKPIKTINAFFVLKALCWHPIISLKYLYKRFIAY